MAVRGVHSDCLNQVVVSGDSDGVIKFWNFSGETKHPQSKITLPSGIVIFRAHAENALVCIVLDNFNVNIMDCDTRTVIRQFSGHTARITDAVFSADSRWLITASMDCSIKVFDIPSAYMIDHFRMDSACIGLSVSPNGETLATAHVNKLGIYTWTNKSLFTHISLSSMDPHSVPPKIDLPSTSSSVQQEHDEMRIKEETDDETRSNLTYVSPPQIDQHLVTMSKVAASRWQNLLNLDIVKKRNRPKTPLTTPKHASFFLPTIAGLDFQFDVSDQKNETNDKELSKSAQTKSNHFSNLTKFGRFLDDTVKTDNYEICIEHITSLGPSAIDFEIKSLDPHAGGNDIVMLQFMKMVNQMFDSNRNFELAQSYLSLFLKEHGSYLVKQSKLRDYLPEIVQAQSKCWETLEQKLLYGIAVASESRLFAH